MKRDLKGEKKLFLFQSLISQLSEYNGRFYTSHGAVFAEMRIRTQRKTKRLT